MLIAQITDTHVGGADVAALYRMDTRAALRAAVDQINALPMRPDVCVITGDLVENGTVDEYRLARSEFARLTMPWFVIPATTIRVNRCAKCSAIATLETGDFLHYVVNDLPLRVIALDSLVEGRTHGKLCEDRTAWLRERLRASIPRCRQY